MARKHFTSSRSLGAGELWMYHRSGGNGVQMPLTEFWPGLQSGLVVGGDLPFLFYVTTPAAQSAAHCSRSACGTCR